jgi:RNA polymerase sigma-70 factor (ECF subfamily)
VRRGQQDASTRLYLRYAERLQRLASRQTPPQLAQRVDPEEIVQSVFRTFFRRVAQGEYDIPDGEEIWKLLLVIALNKLRATGAHHRAAKRDIRRTTGGAEFDRAAEGAAAADDQGLLVLKMVIDELLSDLPESTRRMVELRVEGYEVSEIAARVGRSKRTVERSLQDFRKRLSGLIHEDDVLEEG